MKSNNKKRNLKQAKIQFAVQIGFFNHTNIIINVFMTFIINVLAGVVAVGLLNSIIPLIAGNYLHILYLFIIFTIGELIVKYIFYSINFSMVLRARGMLMFPYYLLIFYTTEMFLDIQFVSLISIFMFALLYSMFRFIVTIVYIKLMSYTKKGEPKVWKKPLKLEK